MQCFASDSEEAFWNQQDCECSTGLWLIGAATFIFGTSGKVPLQRPWEPRKRGGCFNEPDRCYIGSHSEAPFLNQIQNIAESKV